MTFTEVIKIIDETQANFVLLLCHHNSDPDALCSAYAFQCLLKKLRPNVITEIGTGQGISRLSKHLLNYLPISVNMYPNVENAQVIILLDTNTIQQLGRLAKGVAKTVAPIIVIDHHVAHPETENMAKFCVIDDEAASTCEVVYSFFKQLDVKPDLDVAKAIFLGIAFDTRHFVLANSSTFTTIAELCDAGVNAQEVVALLSLPMDLSERVARMKACRRAKLLRIGEWIIALSHVSAYQASAARALIDLGAHMAAVAGQRNGSTEISLRCTREFNQKTGIHLGRDIAKPLGVLLQGMGGGHATAAGMNGAGDVKLGLKRCLRLLKDELSKH